MIGLPENHPDLEFLSELRRGDPRRILKDLTKDGMVRLVVLKESPEEILYWIKLSLDERIPN